MAFLEALQTDAKIADMSLPLDGKVAVPTASLEGATSDAVDANWLGLVESPVSSEGTVSSSLTKPGEHLDSEADGATARSDFVTCTKATTGNLDLAEDFMCIEKTKDGLAIYHAVTPFEKRLVSIAARTATSDGRFRMSFVRRETAARPRVPFAGPPAAREDVPAERATGTSSCLKLLPAELRSLPSVDGFLGPEEVQLHESTIGLNGPCRDTYFNDCFEIKQSRLGGLGAFALRDLQEGEHILKETPLIKTTWSRQSAAFHALGDAERAIFYSLASYKVKENASDIEGVFKANSFQLPQGEVGLFPVASRFNHQCKPARSVLFSYDARSNTMNLTMRKNANAGEELTISYGGTRESLLSCYGFLCQCGSCERETWCEERVHKSGEWQW